MQITELTNSGKMELLDINANRETTYYENPCYRVLGMPFWNTETQDTFIDEFESLVLKNRVR